MKNFRQRLFLKCGSRSRMRGVNTHNKFQTPRTLRTGVIKTGEKNTKIKNNFVIFFLRNCWWSAPHYERDQSADTISDPWGHYDLS